MKEKIWDGKFGRFNVCLDIKNIALGIEIDYDKPFSVDIMLPFIKFGWQMSYEDNNVNEIVVDSAFQWLVETPSVAPDKKLMFKISK